MHYVFLLAYQKYATPTGKTGRVYSDYAECEITYISAAKNIYTYRVDLPGRRGDKRIKKDMEALC